MSLPSIFEYLPDHAEQLIKMAEEESTAKRYGKALLASTLGTGLGLGLGYGGPKVLKKLTGIEIPSKHLMIGAGILGALIAGQQALHDKKAREVVHGADKNTSRRSPVGRLG